MYSVEPGEMKSRNTDDQLNVDLENIPDTALETLITSEEFRQYLFPSDRLVVDTVPYQLMKANVPILRGPDNDRTVVFSDVRKENDTLAGVLSFGILYRVKQPSFQYTIEIYGKDETSLTKHLMGHLKNVIETTDGETYMITFTEKHIQTKVINKTLSDFGVKRTFVRDPVTSEILFTEQFLFEKSLKA